MAQRETDTTIMASQVARMFFDRQMSKIEIAARLDISRFRVARLIDQALAQGLVRIEFLDVPARDRELARLIEGQWDLDLCAVSAASGGATESSITRVVRLAAAILGDLLHSNDVVGIAWGSTLAAVVEEIQPRNDPTIAVVQMAGSSTRIARERTPGELARRLAERLGAVHHPLFAPAFVEGREMRDALMRERDVRATVELFDNITLAIVGIGSMGDRRQGPSSSLLQSGVLDAQEVAELQEAGMVGDLALYPFDGAGRFIEPGLAERAVAISIQQLRNVPRVLAVAAGPNKAAAIRGALNTGVIRILVTDSAAARAVLDMQPSPHDAGPRRTGRLRRQTSRSESLDPADPVDAEPPAAVSPAQVD